MDPDFQNWKKVSRFLIINRKDNSGKNHCRIEKRKEDNKTSLFGNQFWSAFNLSENIVSLNIN